MSKLKWFIIGAMMVTVMAVLVGCGAKNDSESGSNSGSGNNNKSTVENLMTEAATGAKAVSYTHLDVYKRQHLSLKKMLLRLR